LPVYKNEQELRESLRSVLLKMDETKDVYVGVNLASHRYVKYWDKWFGDENLRTPVTQPEIDLLLVDKSYGLKGMELKYFWLKKDGQFIRPFYSGLDEALALLRLGVDDTWLCHCYEPTIPEDRIYNYINEVRELLLGIPTLPINFIAITFDSKNKHEFKSLMLSGRRILTSMFSNLGNTNLVTYRSNPLMSLIGGKEIKEARKFLNHSLRIP